MQFSVIYSVDVPHDVSIKNYSPPQVGRLWNLTEGDEQYEYHLPRRMLGEGKASEMDGSADPKAIRCLREQDRPLRRFHGNDGEHRITRFRIRVVPSN